MLQQWTCFAQVKPGRRFKLVRSAKPGVLPRHCHAVEIATNANIVSPTKARLDRLMAAHRNGCCDSNARSRLPGSRVRCAANTRCTPEPEVAVEREPKGRLPAVLLRVVTQVTLE